MSASLAPQWIFQALTDAGAVASGAKLYSYIAGGGSVPTPLLADDGVTPLANPYTLNSAGRGEFLLDDAISYRLRLETASGDLIEERDSVSNSGWVRKTDLANDTDPALGAGLVGHRGATLAEYADGVTYLCPEPLGSSLDDSLAIQTVLDLANSEGGGRVMLCAGRTYYTRFPLFVAGANVVFDLNGATIQSDMGANGRAVGPIVQIGNCREWNRTLVDTLRTSGDLSSSYQNASYVDPSPGSSPYTFRDDDGSWTVEARDCHVVGPGVLEFVETPYKNARYATQFSNCVDCTVSGYTSIGAGQSFGFGSDTGLRTPYALRCTVRDIVANAPAQGYTYYSAGFWGYCKECWAYNVQAPEEENPLRPTGTLDPNGNLAAFSLAYDCHAVNVSGVVGDWVDGNNQGWLFYVGAALCTVRGSTVVGGKKTFCHGNPSLADAQSCQFIDCNGVNAADLMQITGKNCRFINVRGIGTRRSELNATNINGTSCEFDSCDLDRIAWPDYDAVSWTTGEAVTAGDKRQNRGCTYIAANSGTTGATAPTHTSGSASDGTVTWDYSRSLSDVFLNNRIRNGRTYTGAIQEWAASEFVAWGALRRNSAGDKVYIYTTAGTTGTVEPSHTNQVTTQADGTARNLYFGVRRESLENIYFGWDRFAPLHTSLGSAGISSIANQNSVDLATYVGNTTFRVQLSQIGLYFLKAFYVWGTFAAGSLAAGSVVTINIWRRSGFTGNRTLANFLLYTTTKSPAGASLEDWSISKDSLPIVAWYDNQYSEIWLELVWTNPTIGSFLKNSRITGLRR